MGVANNDAIRTDTSLPCTDVRKQHKLVVVRSLYYIYNTKLYSSGCSPNSLIVNSCNAKTLYEKCDYTDVSTIAMNTLMLSASSICQPLSLTVVSVRCIRPHSAAMSAHAHLLTTDLHILCRRCLPCLHTHTHTRHNQSFLIDISCVWFIGYTNEWPADWGLLAVYGYFLLAGWPCLSIAFLTISPQSLTAGRCYTCTWLSGYIAISHASDSPAKFSLVHGCLVC